MKSSQDLGALLLADGLVFSDRWFSPGEGPFTVLAKLAIANVLSASGVCRVFGVKPSQTREATPHGRSLLHLEWMARGRSAPLLTKHLWERGLLRQSPRWSQAVASDRAFRYCPTCLSMGYQSSLCQIEGLVRCPQHHDLLLKHCTNCNAPTPPYAITTDAFDEPLVCVHCRKAYAPIWQSVDGSLFRTQVGDESAYRRLGKWFERVESIKMQWPDQVGWLADPRAPTQAVKANKRIQVLGMLVSIVPLSGASVFCSSNVWTGRWQLNTCTPQILAARDAARDEITRARLAIYKSIRRHHATRTGVRIRAHIEADGREWIEINEGMVMPGNSHVDPDAHGFLAWRLRFEKSASGGRGASCLSLFPMLLFWPIDWCASDAAWGHFVYRSLLLDITTARELHKTLKGLDSKLPDYFAAWLEIVGHWRHRFGSLARPWPDGLTTLHLPRRGNQPGEVCVLTATSSS